MDQSYKNFISFSSHSDVFLRSACHKQQHAWGWRGDGGGGNFFLMCTLSPFCKCGSFTYNCSWWLQTSFHRKLRGILKNCSSRLQLPSISMSNRGPCEKIRSRKEIKGDYDKRNSKLLFDFCYFHCTSSQYLSSDLGACLHLWEVLRKRARSAVNICPNNFFLKHKCDSITIP